ncbi:hypothetical protein O181_046134 [Austropuccinia psidii MF-1]|uniref:Uncharacterized protein n=1 Tax=Austropuccinia psidii MF-1 TaxID=1389203 RepID=A0A9Q3DNC1_9BASI|nr:hypothetical protein [Austropuccinia psidii MF-1]
MSRSERLEKLIRISNSLNSSQPQNDQIKKDCNFKKISSFKSIANFKISTDQQIITSLNLIELIYQLNQSIQSNLNQDELVEILNDSQTKFLSSNFSAIHQDSLKISIKFLSKFVSIQNLIFNLKNILVSILIKILNLINLELNIIFKDSNDQDQSNQHVMICGSKDLKIIKKLDWKTVFYSPLSLASSPFSFQNQKPNQFHHQICQILSARLLRSSGLSGLFQSIMSDDLNPQMPPNQLQPQTVSDTLNCLSSLYHLLFHPPSHLL